jgi:tyrosine-specific transport protein
MSQAQAATATISSDSTETGGLWSAILLISGTAIGAGMLALPVVTGTAGFYPAMAMSTVCWLFMMFTGLLLLEATFWVKDGSNVLSIAGYLLGPIGKIIGGTWFLFLYYCLMVSYISGGAPLFAKSLGFDFGFSGNLWTFTLLFGVIIYVGTRFVDRINWVLMAGLILSYLLLVGLGSSEIQTSLLNRSNWNYMLVSAPTLFGAYGYHNVIPSLCSYLKRDKKKLRMAIIIGSTIPFVVYSLWQWVILGSVTESQLMEAGKLGVPVSQVLQDVTGHRWVSIFGSYFAFFALVTSLLGVGLSMVDFLGDGLKVKRSGLSRIGLSVLVFLPPALFAIYKPGIFNEAIGVAGGFGEAILNGLLPIAMVWTGRYYHKLHRDDQLPGGRLMLSILLVITVTIVGLEYRHLFF